MLRARSEQVSDVWAVQCSGATRVEVTFQQRAGRQGGRPQRALARASQEGAVGDRRRRFPRDRPARTRCRACARSPKRRAPPSPRSTVTSPTSPICSPAIGERLRDMLWAAIFPSINLASDSGARDHPAAASSTTSELVDQHPNVVRFLLQGRFADQSAVAMTTRSTRAARSRWPWPTCSTTSCATWRRTRGVRAGRVRDFGSAPRRPTGGSAADDDSPRRMPPDKFVAHMTTIMVGAINGTCRAARHQDRRRPAAARGLSAAANTSPDEFEADASCGETPPRTTIGA